MVKHLQLLFVMELKWSDGSDITAEDFVYTWRRMVDPATASEYAYLVSDAHVLNADEVISGEKPVEELGVKADGNKVIFTLSTPAPSIRKFVNFLNFVPQKNHLLRKLAKITVHLQIRCCTQVPFVVEDWNGKQAVVLNS